MDLIFGLGLMGCEFNFIIIVLFGFWVYLIELGKNFESVFYFIKIIFEMIWNFWGEEYEFFYFIKVRVVVKIIGKYWGLDLENLGFNFRFVSYYEIFGKWLNFWKFLLF